MRFLGDLWSRCSVILVVGFEIWKICKFLLLFSHSKSSNPLFIHHIPNDQLLKHYISYLQGKHQIQSTPEYDSTNFSLIPAQSSTEKSTPIPNAGTNNTNNSNNNNQSNNQVQSTDQVTHSKIADDSSSAMKIVAQNGSSQSTNGKAL